MGEVTGKVRGGELCDPLEMGQRREGGCSRCSAAELRVGLGWDWKGAIGEDLQLNLPASLARVINNFYNFNSPAQK